MLFPYDTEKEFATKGKVPVKATFNGVPYTGSLIKYSNPHHMLGHGQHSDSSQEAIALRLLANLTLPDYGGVARHSGGTNNTALQQDGPTYYRVILFIASEGVFSKGHNPRKNHPSASQSAAV